MTAISLKKVSMRFGELEALQDVNLDINEGEFVSLVGASGCGKTTLLRIVAGLERVSSGDIIVYGKPPIELRKQQQIGVAPQRPALVPSRTALENVKMTL